MGADVLTAPLLVEGAVDVLVAAIRQRLPGHLWAIAEQFDDGLPLSAPDPDRYYVSELLEPLQTPACFVLPDRSDHDLTKGQNFAYQTHSMLVGIAADDVDITQLQRRVWRYARGLWLTVHDKSISVPDDPSRGGIHVWVDAIDYSPTFVPARGGDRMFRKDATLRCRVLHTEEF